MGGTDATMAWNNLVMHIHPQSYDAGDERRSAAIAALYMAEANNGGLNAFLTNNPGMGTQEVLASLDSIGAEAAADQFRDLIEALGRHLPPATEDERWDELEARWTDALDESDFLTSEADESLMSALRGHVSRHMDHYVTLPRHDGS